LLQNKGINVDIINARFAKPIDQKLISMARSGKAIITVEDHSVSCGFGSALLEAVASSGIGDFKCRIINLGGPDRFVMQDTRQNQFAECGISAEKIVDTVCSMQ